MRQVPLSFVETKTAPDGSITFGLIPARRCFPGGKLAMLTAARGRNFLHESDVMSRSALRKGKQRATIIHGLSNVVGGRQSTEQAKQWVAFLGSKEAQNILAKTGAVIPAYEGMQQDWVNAIPDMDLQVFI